MSKGKFIHRESDVAAQWGVSRAIIRDCRQQLTEGEHWGKQNGQHIAYSVDGLALLDELVRGNTTQKEDPPQEFAPVSVPVEDRTVIETEQPPAVSVVLEREEPAQEDALMAAGLSLSPEKKSNPREEVLEVVKVFQINRMALSAKDPDGGSIPVTVRVRSNEHFHSGMLIPCQHLSGSLWKLKGRLPRWKGEKLVR